MAWKSGVSVKWWRVEEQGLEWLGKGECQGKLYGAFQKDLTIYQLTYLLKEFYLQTV